MDGAGSAGDVTGWNRWCTCWLSSAGPVDDRADRGSAAVLTSTTLRRLPDTCRRQPVLARRGDRRYAFVTWAGDGLLPLLEPFSRSRSGFWPPPPGGPPGPGCGGP